MANPAPRTDRSSVVTRAAKLHAGAMGDALRDTLASATRRRLSTEEYLLCEAMVTEFERRAKRHA